MMQKPGPQRGYSLYELVMSLALFALMLTIGLPSLTGIVANHRLRVEVDALFHGIYEARKESVALRRVVSLCPSHDGARCAGREHWSDGWLMFVNSDRDWPAQRDDNESIIKYLRVNPANRIVANRDSFSLRSTWLRATNGTLIFCDRAKQAEPRAIVVSYTGRPRIAYRDRHGRPYTCPD